MCWMQAALAKVVADPEEARACLRPALLAQMAALRMQLVLDIREPQLVQLLRVRPVAAQHAVIISFNLCHAAGSCVGHMECSCICCAMQHALPACIML